MDFVWYIVFAILVIAVIITVAIIIVKRREAKRKNDIISLFQAANEKQNITEYKIEYVKKEAIRIENFDIDNLCQVLKPYYKGGRFDYLLNAEENINLIDKRFIVFEIDNIIPMTVFKVKTIFVFV